MFIYDRWGKLVYESKGTSEGWNGIRMDNGMKAEISSYVYYAMYPPGNEIISQYVQDASNMFGHHI